MIGYMFVDLRRNQARRSHVSLGWCIHLAAVECPGPLKVARVQACRASPAVAPTEFDVLPPAESVRAHPPWLPPA